MANLPKEAWGAIAAIIAALIAVASAIYNALQKSKADQNLELYKLEMNKQMADHGAALADRNSVQAARREYEFEARKRLYKECEPLFFRFSDNGINAYYRIQGLARGSRDKTLDARNYLGSYDYYFKSTIYKLFAPIAIYRLMLDKLTLVDLKLDNCLNLQYMVVKQLYLSWTDDFVFANYAGCEYDPNNMDWKTLREAKPQHFWRQGLPMGLLDIVIELLLTEDGDHRRLISYGEFEKNINNDDYTRHQLELVKDVLTKFTPETRPVLWNLLVTQAILYRGLINIQYADDVPMDSNGEWYKKMFELDVQEVEKFKINAGGAEEENKQLSEAMRVAKEYIMTTLSPENPGMRKR